MVLVGGFVGAHLVDRLIYFPTETLKDPLTLLWFWQGISSFGGLLGGTVAAALFIRRERLAAIRWRYLDAIAYAFVFGWIFGRLGCFTAFDHPGAPTHFFLGETYRDGVVRHNLGLYEALYFVVLAMLFARLGRRRRAPGFYLGLLCVAYPPVRFGLDFLRIIDVRYLGLTPAQWGSLGFVVLGLVLLARTRRFAAAEVTGSVAQGRRRASEGEALRNQRNGRRRGGLDGHWS